MAELSVIIPTHKRARLLERCIHHLQKQTVYDKLEIIVVSDGHDDATVDAVAGLPVRFYAIEKSQQGVARNKGVEKATAPLVLFMGDDLFLEPDACEKHLAAHEEGPHAVLGFTTWDPTLQITPVMKWLEQSGWQFGYPMLKRYTHGHIPKNIQERFSYTIHISLPTEIAKKYPFRSDVKEYGWEDIAWGKQLAEAGLPLFYEPDAIGFHHHPMNMEQSLKRMETLGKTVKNYPEIQRAPQGLKKLLYRVAALLPTMTGRHRRAFLRGLKAQD